MQNTKLKYLIYFENKNSLVNLGVGFNEGKKKLLKVYATIDSQSPYTSYNNIETARSSHIFTVQIGNKVDKIDNNYNIIFDKKRFKIDKIKIDTKDMEHKIFYCSLEGESSKEQNGGGQKEEDKIVW